MSLLGEIGGLLRRSFTRPGSSLEYIPQVDGLRAVAVLLVLGHHVFATYLTDTHRLGTELLPRDWGKIAPFDPIVWWGLNLVIGVPIFCVISGFVLSIPFAKNYLRGTPPPSIGLYFLRRLIRLEPPFVLSMLFGFALLVIHLDKPRWYFWVMVKIFGPHLMASLVYLHGLIYADASWIAGISWTLEIEVQFYILLPLLALLFKLKQRWLRRGILLAAVVASGVYAQVMLPALHNRRLDLSLLDLLHFFLAGMLLADFYLEPPQREMGARWADAVVLMCTGMLVYVVHYNLAWTWLEPLLIAVGFFAVFRGAWASRIFCWVPLTAVGAMSYTVYLYHLYVVELLMPFTSRWLGSSHALWVDSVAQFVVLLLPVLLVSAALYLIAERPFVLLSHNVTRRLRAGKAQAGVAV